MTEIEYQEFVRHCPYDAMETDIGTDSGKKTGKRLNLKSK